MKLFNLGMFLPPEKASALAKLQSLSNSRDVLFQLANTIPNSKHSPQGGVLDLRPGIQLLKYWMLSWLGGLARPKLDIDRLALDPLDRADIEADWHVPKKGDRRPRLKPLPTFRLRRNSGLRSYSEGCQDISIFDFIFRSIIKFLRPLAYGSGQAVLPFTLFEGLNSRDEKKGEWEIVRKLSIRSNSICRIREPLVKKGSLYTLQQKRLLTESHPSLPSFSSQDNEAYAQQRYRSSKLLTPSACLPDPGPGIVLALHPTHMIETDVCLPLPTNLLPVLLSQDVGSGTPFIPSDLFPIPRKVDAKTGNDLNNF
ncbi:hypothetical protein V6N12_028563 [Hibiscus sabdariffa]|uniref:Uncharacterized protein n=1 Tax=Hibiscus sabdariffa TaxID=183260 RepID=A0ABR2F682_9ROSI